MTQQSKINQIKEYVKNNRIIIGFSGQSGTGKTTLSEWLSTNLDIKYIPEVARFLLTILKNDIISVNDFQDTILIIYEHMLCYSMFNSNKSIVCDRIINDVFVYRNITYNYDKLEIDNKYKYDILITLSQLKKDNSKIYRDFTEEQHNILDRKFLEGQKRVVENGAYHIHISSNTLYDRKEILINEIFDFINKK